ncbi:MAG: TonB-dependent receptor [Sphingomicrobium sp.]
MMNSPKLVASFLATAGLCWPAIAEAQTAPDPAAVEATAATPAVQPAAVDPTTQQPAAEDVATDDADAEEIVVIGRRDPNAVIGDIPPENTLTSRDIRAYGATSVSELLDAIAPQTASSRGRNGGGPIVLLNGKRISGFREVRDLPPEAILRLDILPEEVALKYGYRADQRVVNIVLRPRFRSTTAQAEGAIPTEGGKSEEKADLTRLMIGENGRTTLNVHAERASPLLESERDIDPPEPGETDQREFRTLIGSRRLVRGGGTVNRTLFGDVSSTFDGQVEYSDGRSLLGASRERVGEPLRRDTDNVSGHAGIALNGQKDRWRWSATGTYDISRSRTATEQERELLGAATNHARSFSNTGALDLVANGPLLTLPAGTANVTIKAGANTSDLESRSERFGVVTRSDLGRDELSSSVNVDLPIARRDEVLSAIGNLTINGNAEVEHLSDFGTLSVLGAGAYWSPVERVNLIASYTREEGAPSLTQLGNPVISTPETRIYDFVRGEDTLVTTITGGNPSLESDVRRVMKIGGTVRPWSKTDLEIRADYVHTRTKDPISSFPGPTEAIEEAFPERFLRDQEGNLVSVDLRPVNFDSSAKDELRWGFNFSKPLSSARPTQAQIDQFRRQREQSGQPVPAFPAGGSGNNAGGRGNAGSGGWQGRQGGRGFGGGGAFGGGRQGGRLQLSVFHTWLLKDEVKIAPGLPVLDYLDGEVADAGSGRSRHRIEANGGYFNNGLGARFSINWQNGSHVNGGETGELDFAPLTKVNANLFANLGERFDLVTKYPWLRGTQVRLSVDNIFDAKQRVRDAAGFVPVNYQSDLLDPQGRTIRLSIRKLFLPPRSFFRSSGGQGGGARTGATRPGS